MGPKAGKFPNKMPSYLRLEMCFCRVLQMTFFSLLKNNTQVAPSIGAIRNEDEGLVAVPHCWFIHSDSSVAPPPSEGVFGVGSAIPLHFQKE